LGDFFLITSEHTEFGFTNWVAFYTEHLDTLNGGFQIRPLFLVTSGHTE